MFKSYNINGKDIKIHYKIRIKGIYNLIKAYYLGVSEKVHEKAQTITLDLVERYRKFKYRKITKLLENLEDIDNKRRMLVCGGFLCIECPGYMTCSYL